MDIGKAAFLALYPPLILMAAFAAWLLMSNVILPAWRKGRLSLKHHGFAGCIVLALSSDAVEHAYYGVGRFFPDLQPMIHGNWGALTTVRLFIMSASVLAIATYAVIVGWSVNAVRILAVCGLIWAISFAYLRWWGIG